MLFHFYGSGRIQAKAYLKRLESFSISMNILTRFLNPSTHAIFWVPLFLYHIIIFLLNESQNFEFRHHRKVKHYNVTSEFVNSRMLQIIIIFRMLKQK